MSYTALPRLVPANRFLNQAHPLSLKPSKLTQDSGLDVWILHTHENTPSVRRGFHSRVVIIIPPCQSTDGSTKVFIVCSCPHMVLTAGKFYFNPIFHLQKTSKGNL